MQIGPGSDRRRDALQRLLIAGSDAGAELHLGRHDMQGEFLGRLRAAGDGLLAQRHQLAARKIAGAYRRRA